MSDDELVIESNDADELVIEENDEVKRPRHQQPAVAIANWPDC